MEMKKKIKYRTEEEKKQLIRRLNIINGQVNGLKQMIEYDRHCSDILIQVSAITKSLKSFGNVLLKSHLKTCVVNDIKNDKLSALDEVVDLFNKLNK